MQEEEGENGTRHIQGTVHYRNQIAFSTLKQISSKIHWERCIDLRASIKYCTNIEKRRGQIWTRGFTIPGEQMQLLRQDQLHDWQADIIDTLRGAPDDRTVNWVTDTEGGKGKTALCKYILSTFSNVLFLSSSSTKDALFQIVKEKKNFKIVLFNFPRMAEGHISYSAFEAIKDGLCYSGKYEGGYKIFPSPHVYIFANWSPDMSQLSRDRWNEIQI